jgi:hypothetical protein
MSKKHFERLVNLLQECGVTDVERINKILIEYQTPYNYSVAAIYIATFTLLMFTITYCFK